MPFTLNIETGNAAMLTPEDVADALERVAQDMRDYGATDGGIRDLNGNTVGDFTLDLPEPVEPLTPEEIEQVETWTEIVNAGEESERMDEYPGLDLIDRYETERNGV